MKLLLLAGMSLLLGVTTASAQTNSTATAEQRAEHMQPQVALAQTQLTIEVTPTAAHAFSTKHVVAFDAQAATELPADLVLNQVRQLATTNQLGEAALIRLLVVARSEAAGSLSPSEALLLRTELLQRELKRRKSAGFYAWLQVPNQRE